MNRVFANQLRKGRGVLALSGAERKVVVVVVVLTYCLANVIAAIAAGAVAAAVVLLHRRSDNHRFDHLELLARRWGIAARPRWSLCERDDEYVAYKPLGCPFSTQRFKDGPNHRGGD